MTTVSKHKVSAPKTKVSSRAPIRPGKKSVKAGASTSSRGRRGKASTGERILLSGGAPAELRTLGVMLASEMDQDVYCVDLSRVAGKYIGETEKNLSRVFALGEATGAVLFFDEADALLGRRTEVKGSHERYANLEVSYLLEQIEEYRGLVILATNKRANLDGAFLRRLRFTNAVERTVLRKKV